MEWKTISLTNSGKTEYVLNFSTKNISFEVVNVQNTKGNYLNLIK